MSTDIHLNQLPEAARDLARQAADQAKEIAQEATDVVMDGADATKDVAQTATDKARDICQSAAQKAGDTLKTSKEYVRRNPMPVVLGAIAFGVAIGYLLVRARHRPTFAERFVDQPLHSVREAALAALAPVTHRVHSGYDSARDGVKMAMDEVRRFSPGSASDSLSDRISRIGNNLKFW